MFWIWLGLGVMLSVPLGLLVLLTLLHFYLRWKYMHYLLRVFQEKPLFIIPRGQPVGGAEDVRIQTADGLTLRGCYLHTPLRRRGVILFGLEFGSNRWSCHAYCEHLLAKGFDVFAFESRGQGESGLQPGYEPAVWVTDFDVHDMQAALAYLKGRSDADPRGIGFFGISKGGVAGLLVAARDPYIRCFVTDGIYATYTTMVVYMRKWFSIYNAHYKLQGLLPLWYYGLVGLAGLKQVERERRFRFAHLERAIAKLAPRPLLMIHGAGDTYVKPEMARALFNLARDPKEIWLVAGAKHNQALQVAGEEYSRRVLAFFEQHLVELPAQASANGTAKSPAALAESA